MSRAKAVQCPAFREPKGWTARANMGETRPVMVEWNRKCIWQVAEASRRFLCQNIFDMQRF
jgi:hypothetical protein